MSALFSASVLYLGLLFGVTWTQHPISSCQDLDTHGCEVFFKAKPDLCSDPGFSQSTCKRFCGNCPVECYNCPQPVRDLNNCNTTMTCGGNMTCVSKHLHAPDGHHEYILTCEPKEICTGLSFGFGKRDLEDIEQNESKERLEREVVLDCCDTDFCNYPVQTTTTTTTTTATTPPRPPTTTKQPLPVLPTTRCNRDIVFVLDSSGSVGHTNFKHALDFVQQFVSRIDVGPTEAQVALMTFSATPRIEWYLTKYTTNSQIISAVQHVPYVVGSTHTGDAIKAVVQQVFGPAHGDRPHSENAVVIITDGQSNNHQETIKESVTLHTIAKDVVAIGVGSGFDLSELNAIATNSAHVFDVHSYPNLQNIIPQMLSSICS